MVVLKGLIRKPRLQYILLCLAGALSVVLIRQTISGQNRPHSKQLEVPPQSSLHNKKETKERTPAGVKINEKMCFNMSNYNIQRAAREGIQNKSIFYCGVPKVASTFTHGLLSRIPKCKQRGFCYNRDDGYQRPPNNATFSFMWVREPYSRLFSAYENKLFHPNDFWNSLGKPIIKRRRKDPTKKSLMLGHDVTFAELVQDVLNLTAVGSKLNIHVQPINQICDPCNVPFDFVGKLETFTSDIGHVCQQFRQMHLLEGMDVTSSCDDILPEKLMFSRVSKLFSILKWHSKELTRKDKLDIMDRTWRSYQIRGFVSKNIKMPFSEADLDKVSMKRYQKALNYSLKASQNATELKAQRREALVQAYMTVPGKDMKRLEGFVRRDCLLFGYDERPEHLFQSREQFRPSFDYFGGLL